MLKSASLCRLLVAAVVAFASSGSFAALTGSFDPDVPTVTLDLYDGTESLTDIKITLSLTINDGQFEFDNDNSNAVSVIVDLNATATMTSTDVVVPTTASVTVPYENTIDLAANDGDSNRAFNYDGLDYASFNTETLSVSAVLNVSPADFSSYLGEGTFDVDVAISEILNITADSGVAIRSIPVLEYGTVSIEYLIPEPISIALFGFGGLMISRRRRCEK